MYVLKIKKNKLERWREDREDGGGKREREKERGE